MTTGAPVSRRPVYVGHCLTRLFLRLELQRRVDISKLSGVGISHNWNGFMTAAQVGRAGVWGGSPLAALAPTQASAVPLRAGKYGSSIWHAWTRRGAWSPGAPAD